MAKSEIARELRGELRRKAHLDAILNSEKSTHLTIDATFQWGGLVAGRSVLCPCRV